MLDLVHRLLDKFSTEGESLPRAKIYSRFFSTSTLMRAFYKDMACEVAGEVHQGKVLDVGTGPGCLPIEIAHLAPNVEVLGIDVSSEMVRIARKNAEEASIPDRVRFVVQDANAMSFEDSSFDLVVSTGAFHHWKRPVRIINEIHRILKDRRQAWILDLRRDAPDQMVETLRKYGYGRMTSWISANFVRSHSGATLGEVVSALKDAENRFRQYGIEENWHSYPCLMVKLFKS